MPCYLIISNLKSRKFLGKAFRVINPQLQILLTHQRSICKKNLKTTLVCTFIEGIWFHTQREDRPNTSNIWSPQRTCYCYNGALQKHESNGLLTWWWHWLLFCPVSWGCRIHWLLFCRGVRPPPQKKTNKPSALDMTLNNLMVRFGECGVVLRCHCTQVHSGLEW